MDPNYYVAWLENSNFGACHQAASEAGHTPEEADNCDDGELRCPNCPWEN